MSGICLGVALAVIQAVLPSNTLALSWKHSVEKIQWTEHYRVEAARLVLSEATVEGTGAGMDPPADAVFDGKVWRYTPALPPLPRVVLTRSTYTADYTLCWNGRCQTLTEIVGPLRHEGETIELFACP